VTEGLAVSAQSGPVDISVGRLLPHVLEATAHAQRLEAVPDLSVRVLSTVGSTLLEMGQLDTARPVLDRALAVAREKVPGVPFIFVCGSAHADQVGESLRAGQFVMTGALPGCVAVSVAKRWRRPI